MKTPTSDGGLSTLADEAQVLLNRESAHLVAVRDWLQQIVTVWAQDNVNAGIPHLEESARMLAEERRRFRNSLSRVLRLPVADCGLSALLPRLPAERRSALSTARSHVLWLAGQVAQMTRLARMQSNDLAGCLNLFLSGADGTSGSVDRYDGRGLRTHSPRATLLNDRC